MPAEEIPPKETIYVNNLNERINKEELKKSLYAAFSQFGPILDVVALKTFRMRGQAFIVFRDISAATQAVVQLLAHVRRRFGLSVQCHVVCLAEATYAMHRRNAENVDLAAALLRRVEQLPPPSLAWRCTSPCRPHARRSGARCLGLTWRRP